MPEFSLAQLRLIEQLLHDAVLRDLIWDQALSTITARFDCLRRNTNGSDLEDRVVELKLADVTAVAVGYDSSSLTVRPSQFEPRRRITAQDLSAWPYRPQEAALWIDSTINDDALSSARVDWLKGDQQAIQASPCTFCLMFGQWRDFGMPVILVRVVAAGSSFSITSGGAPLEIDQWEAQFAAWWQGWKEYWDAQYAGKDDKVRPYDAAIPAGEPERGNPDYQPPKEPAFALMPTDAPPEVTEVLREWFESQDWNTGDDFGRWAYARAVEDWWIEGARACVVVRGIEHVMPLEGDPAENREAVWTFALRHRRGKWIIDTYSQGWPDFGSAKRLSVKQKPWLEQWE